MDRFRDRVEAGRRLADALRGRTWRDPLVLGLPRGGLPVACEVARALGAPLDVVVSRKLGVPGQEELAMGAVAGDTLVVNRDVVNVLRIPERVVEQVARRERVEVARRERMYRRGRPAPQVRGRTVIVVDDGLATGASMRAAIASLRRGGAGRVVVAVPTGSTETCDQLRREADEVVCLQTPEPYFAVGLWYEDFSPTTDEQVCAIMAQAAGEWRGPQPAAHR